MSVLVVDIMCKSLLPDKLDLLYNDNLIKCDTILKNKNIFILMYHLIINSYKIKFISIFKFNKYLYLFLEIN